MRAERKRKKKKVLWIVLSIIGLFVLATGGYAYHLWNTAASTVAGIQENLKKSDKRDKDVDLSKKDPISILVMGVDERKNDRGRRYINIHDSKSENKNDRDGEHPA